MISILFVIGSIIWLIIAISGWFTADTQTDDIEANIALIIAIVSIIAARVCIDEDSN